MSINTPIGNRAYQYCSYCTCRGIWNRAIYCPFSPPLDAPDTVVRSQWQRYGRASLPIRDNDKFREDAQHIEETGHTAAADHTGITGLAILARLPSIDFPRSFPPDSMHLFFENVIPALVRHYRGVFFKTNHGADRAARTASDNGQVQSGRPGGLGARRRPAVGSRSTAARGAAGRSGAGADRGAGSTGGQVLQEPKRKFKKTSDPWNVKPDVWERIGLDQEVCKDPSIKLVTNISAPATTTASMCLIIYPLP